MSRLSYAFLSNVERRKESTRKTEKNWVKGIRKAMKKNLKEGQWRDRKLWSLGVGQCRKTF
jgi:hypothetical protein